MTSAEQLELLELKLSNAKAMAVRVTEDSLTVDLTDGRTISVPVVWFPRLSHGTPQERSNFKLVGGGESIHWPDLDEDIGVRTLLIGPGRGESPASFQRWLDGRKVAV
jgi:hypothetical protein